MSSTDPARNSTRRRPRPILSCLECRRKKLGCDRQTPCGQCIKAEYPESCTYEAPRKAARVTPATPQDGASSRDGPSGSELRSVSPAATVRSGDGQGPAVQGIGIIEDLQRRIAKLEQAAGEPRTAAPEGNGSKVPEHSKEAVSYYGARYAPYAENHWRHLYEPFAEIRKFLKRLSDDPSTRPYVERLMRYAAWHASMLDQEPGARPPRDLVGLVTQMAALLPGRAECDELVRVYFANCEKPLRVLHRASFEAAYARFRARSARVAAGAEAPPDEASEEVWFVPQLAAVLAVAAKKKGQPAEEGSAASPLAAAPPALLVRTELIEMVHGWSQRLGHADRLQIRTLQTRTLLVQAKHTTLLPSDIAWQSTGGLVRHAMLLGLHRDPADAAPELSPLDVQLRRRLWAAIVEMDLQSSLGWGMPTAVTDANFDTLPPANLDDDDLVAVPLPVPRPPDVWSDALVQAVLARSLPLRLRVASFLNDLRRDSDPDLRLRLGRKVEELLASVPPAARVAANHPHADPAPGRPGRLLSRIVLDISLRRMLLYLFRPFAMNMNNKDFFRARRVCRDSALAILSYKDAFRQDAADIDAADAAYCQELFNDAYRHDMLVACYSLCWEIRMIGFSHHWDAAELERFSLAGESWTKAGLGTVVHEAIGTFSLHNNIPPNFIKNIFILSVILESVVWSGPTKDLEPHLRLMIDKLSDKIFSRLERLYPEEQGQQDGTFNLDMDIQAEYAQLQGTFNIDFLISESLTGHETDGAFPMWPTPIPT